MLKWILIPIGVIILIIVAIVVALYVLIFVSKAPLARPITYESEEQAVAGAVSDMLEGLLGITLSESQEDDLEQLLIDFSSGDADISDIQAFILDDTTGVMATSTISLTGTRGVEINEVQLTALINLLIGNVDSFVDDANISSENGVLTYSTGLGDVKISGFGLNINEGNIAMVLQVTLPQNIPYVGFLIGGKSISIGLNPTYTIEEDGTVAIDLNLDGLRIGGISASWPGVSYGVNYVKNMIGEGALQHEFNIANSVKSFLPLDLTFSAVEGKLGLVGPPTISSGMRPVVFDSDDDRQQAAGAAQDAIAAFIGGESDNLVLTEEALTALLAENILGQLGDTDLGIDLDDFTVNVNEGGLTLSSTVTLPEDTGLPGGFGGAEVEIGFIVEPVIDDEGNVSMQIVGLDVGGLPQEALEEFGLDIDTLNQSLADAGIDLAEALGLPEGSLTGLSTEEGVFTLY